MDPHLSKRKAFTSAESLQWNTLKFSPMSLRNSLRGLSSMMRRKGSDIPPLSDAASLFFPRFRGRYAQTSVFAYVVRCAQTGLESANGALTIMTYEKSDGRVVDEGDANWNPSAMCNQIVWASTSISFQSQQASRTSRKMDKVRHGGLLIW